IGGQRRDLLLLAVEDLLRELLLVQVLARAPVDEVELGGEAEALALEVAVGPDQAGAGGAGVADHPLLGLEPGAVLLLEADAAGDDERVLELLAHLAPVVGVAQHALGLDLVLLLLLLGVLAALSQLLQGLLERVLQRGMV